MRIPDALMKEWFELLTDRPAARDRTSYLAGKPNEAKKALGAEIVRFYHGDAAATAVLDDWRKQFEEKGDPENIPEVTIRGGEAQGRCDARGRSHRRNEVGRRARAKRVARSKKGAFNYGPDRTKVTDVKASVAVCDGLVVRLGRKILRVKLS